MNTARPGEGNPFWLADSVDVQPGAPIMTSAQNKSRARDRSKFISEHWCAWDDLPRSCGSTAYIFPASRRLAPSRRRAVQVTICGSTFDKGGCCRAECPRFTRLDGARFQRTCVLAQRPDADKPDDTQEEVRSLKETPAITRGRRRIQLTGRQCRRLAIKGKALTPDERGSCCELVRDVVEVVPGSPHSSACAPALMAAASRCRRIGLAAVGHIVAMAASLRSS